VLPCIPYGSVSLCSCPHQCNVLMLLQLVLPLSRGNSAATVAAQQLLSCVTFPSYTNYSTTAHTNYPTTPPTKAGQAAALS